MWVHEIYVSLASPVARLVGLVARAVPGSILFACRSVRRSVGPSVCGCPSLCLSVGLIGM